MNEQKTINGKDIIKLLLGNKWLYLIMMACFFVASFVGMSLASSARKQYVAFFDYNVAGFNTVVDENGEKNSYYIDGEKFDPRAIVTKEKIAHYIESNIYLSGLDAEKMSQRNIVSSFSYITRYKENDHKMDDNDGAYIEDQKGYELVLESYGLNDFQAKVLCECIANEVINVSKTKIDNLKYDKYIVSYDKAKSYPDKISNLVSGIENLVNLSNELMSKYGDVILDEGNYGGDEGTYYLDKISISDWQNMLTDFFKNYYVDSLLNELEINGYIFTESKEYIDSLKSAVATLNREISVNEAVLNNLKTQRDNLVASVGSNSAGSNATVESLEIREYNIEIIDLTKKIAEQKEQVDLYQLQLDKLDTGSFTPEQLAEYQSNLSSFENKLEEIRSKLVFYVKQYESIAKKIMKENLNVFYDTEEVITPRGEIDILIILTASLAVGLFVPMLINLVLAGFNVAEGKPLFNFKKNKETSEK